VSALSRFAPWGIGALAGAAVHAARRDDVATVGIAAAIGVIAYACLRALSPSPSPSPSPLPPLAALPSPDAAAFAGALAAAGIVAAALPWSPALGPTAIAVALAVAAITCADRVAVGGQHVAGIAGAIALGAAIAVDRSALALAPPIVALWLLRARHGARWALLGIPFAAGTTLLGIATIPALDPVVATPRETYAIAAADAIGAIAALAALAGLVALASRKRTRWLSSFATAAIAGGIALDLSFTGTVGPVPLAGAAIAAGAAVASFARTAGPPIGQACIGIATATIIVIPAAI
jgi:hypothetical protein